MPLVLYHLFLPFLSVGLAYIYNSVLALKFLRTNYFEIERLAAMASKKALISMLN